MTNLPNKAASDLIVIITTCPDQASANQLVENLLKQQLSACIQQTPIVSHYVWAGKQEVSSEIKLEIKTLAKLFNETRDCLLSLHPYKCPEIIALPALYATDAYADWLIENVKETQ